MAASCALARAALIAASASAKSLLSVELLAEITDLVIVYFLIVMVRLIDVWVGI